MLGQLQGLHQALPNPLTSDPLRVLTARGRGLVSFSAFNPHGRIFLWTLACTRTMLHYDLCVGPFTHLLLTTKVYVAISIGKMMVKVVNSSGTGFCLAMLVQLSAFEV